MRSGRSARPHTNGQLKGERSKGPEARSRGPDCRAPRATCGSLPVVQSAVDPVVPVVRHHWWSPAPAPDLPPISARRGYTEVLLVYAGFFLSGVVAAGILLGGRYRNPFPNGSWADYAPQFVEVLAQTGLAIA